MNGTWQIARQRDYRGGEVQALLPEMVARNQLLRMENAMIFPNGFVTAFFQTDVQTLIGASGGIAISPNNNGTWTYYATPTTGTITVGTFNTALDTPVSVGSGTSHAVGSAQMSGASKAVLYLGKWYCPNATGGILNLSDFTFIAISGKNVKHLYIYTNRLWAVCGDGSLMISDNGDATTWNPLNIIFLPNTDPIIDFIPVQGGAIVYSTTSIYAMYGSSYLDITFLLLLDRQQFSSGAVDIDGTVFIVGTRGVYAASLNGCQLIPHNQNVYFQQNFPTFSTSAVAIDIVKGIYLQRFEAILFMWDVTYGETQGFVFYPQNKAYTKINQLLTSAFPYMLAINDANTDFLIGTDAGVLCKSTYPSANTLNPRESVIQTRIEDADSLRSKVWRELSIDVDQTVYGVSIDASLDDGDTFTNISSGGALLSPGRNVFWLDLPRSQSISFRFTISNTTDLFLSDDVGNLLTDDVGNELTFSGVSGSYTLKEVRVKYREAGPIA